MSVYSMNEVRNGTKVILDGDPGVVLENEYVKPGKGQAFNRVKIRNLKTGRVIERTYKSNDTIEGADVVDVEVQYLYNDGTLWHFMSHETFEQYTANEVEMGDAKQWIKEQSDCVLTLWNGTVIQATPPIFVILKITETDPGLRGDTSSGGSKTAKLETGAVVRVPLFLQEGELLKIDTRTGAYVSRAKE